MTKAPRLMSRDFCRIVERHSKWKYGIKSTAWHLVMRDINRLLKRRMGLK